MRQNYFFEYVPNAYINLCVDKAQQMQTTASSTTSRQAIRRPYTSAQSG